MHDRELTPDARAVAELVAEGLIMQRTFFEGLRK